MIETTFKNIIVTRQQVLAALAHFATLYANPNAYESWLDKGSYKHAIDHDGKLYPPKYILSQVTELGLDQFHGGEETNRVFRQLGFSIVSK